MPKAETRIMSDFVFEFFKVTPEALASGKRKLP
jgi:hypothetical protein